MTGIGSNGLPNEYKYNHGKTTRMATFSIYLGT